MKLPRALLALVAVVATLRCGDSPGPSLPADIEVSLSAAAFDATSDGANPAPVVIQVTNAGEEPLTQLAAAVGYATGQPTGWINATLSSTSAPATLTITASLGSLLGGSYDGTVTVSSPDAAHGSIIVNVSLTVAPAAPAAPSALTAASATYSRIDLQWSDNSRVEDGFRIERCEGDACTSFAYVTGVDANATSYAHVGFSTPSTHYRYRVQSVNADGLSAWSNVAEVTTPAQATSP